MDVLKTELSEREKSRRRRPKWLVTYCRWRAFYSKPWMNLKNERAAEELRTSDAQLLQLKQELAEVRESAWEKS